MPLPPNFPASPHAILPPDARWTPTESDVRMEKLPPLVKKLREKICQWRADNYAGATDTSRSLLQWWFGETHLLYDAEGVGHEFQYYFAQREAIESIVYLYEVAKVQDKHDLMRFDSSGAVNGNMFDEDWLRFVIKMATGSGKTKVLSLALAWCYFHKCYEPDSKLARNFLVIAPNIIVFDRLKKDFDGLRIFFTDPVLPDDGYNGKNWRNDFQLTVHLQDEVRAVRSVGNIFLTNIHRVYSSNDTLPSKDDENSMDYFLGKKPTGATTDSKVDLGMIVREIDELAVLNDEAHHIHDKKLAWFQAIEDIHNRLKQKGGGLAIQIDTSATPKHNNGAIFAQTVADYPLVEAIWQNIVKHPVLPDAKSYGKLEEKPSSKFSEKYADYINLGVVEWRKANAEHNKMNKKAILFVMTDDTKNCDDVAEYLENTFPEFEDSVLVIHTKNNGEISESASGKNKLELDELRKQANNIDSADNPYKAIVSVLVLKEGWDVRNVTTIVGLRAYSAKSNILPEQTLGRGLRRMYPDTDAKEKLSVIGTTAFMEFVESIQSEGVILQREKMGDEDDGNAPFVIEVDNANTEKNIDELDIQIPVLAPRTYRQYSYLENLDVSTFTHEKIKYQSLDGDKNKRREIVFHYIAKDETSHKTVLDDSGISDYRSAVGYLSQVIVKELRLVNAYHVIYAKVKEFVRDYLFQQPVDLENSNTLFNLADTGTVKRVIDTFKQEVNKVTLCDKGAAGLERMIKVSATRPFRVKPQAIIFAKKSVFNKIIGDSSLELNFAKFLENCDDVIAYTKNYLAVGFRLDYVRESGDFSQYIPDFFVKTSAGDIVIIETKGREELDIVNKMTRLKQWCEDVNAAQSAAMYCFVYVDEGGFTKHKFKNFAALVENFREYQ